MRGVWVAVPLLLVGCLGPEGPGSTTSTPQACTLVYPDGAPVDCQGTSLMTSGILATPPSLQAGWTCLRAYNQADIPAAFSIYAHQDGRIGVYWDARMDRQGGLGFVEVNMYYAKGGQLLAVPYQAKGFAVFPQKPAESTVEFHLLARHFLLDVERGVSWDPAANASIIAGKFEGSAWWAWRYEVDHATKYLGLMNHVPSTETRRQYSPQKAYVEYPDYNVFATVWGAGYKAANTPLTPDPARSLNCPRDSPMEAIP